jgi:hypothetical protein
MSEDIFDPEGDGYDYATAETVGMKANDDGHWGSVAPVSPELIEKLKLPKESYILLKGRKHKTWDLAVAAEKDRGFKVIKFGERYISVPEEWMP